VRPVRSALDLLASAASLAKVGALATPFLLGLFLGVPLVAREIEGRTASIAWTLSGSRRRWLVHRAAPVVVVVVLAALLVGIGGEVLTRSAPGNEGVDPGFGDYGSRGALVAVRALAVLTLGIGVGALVPRQLPALLLALGTTIALFAALTLGMDAWMAAEAVPIEVGPAQQGASRIFDMAYREDATGRLISFADYYSNHGGDIGVPEGEEPIGMTMVAYQVPGDRYGGFVMGGVGSARRRRGGGAGRHGRGRQRAATVGGARAARFFLLARARTGWRPTRAALWRRSLPHCNRVAVTRPRDGIPCQIATGLLLGDWTGDVRLGGF
jgi:hypothetical protein